MGGRRNAGGLVLNNYFLLTSGILAYKFMISTFSSFVDAYPLDPREWVKRRKLHTGIIDPKSEEGEMEIATKC